MSLLPLYMATGALSLSLLYLGTGTRSPVGRATARPAVLALACLTVLVLANGQGVTWPYLVMAGGALVGVWESYAGVYSFLLAPGAAYNPAEQVRICLVWLVGVLSNLSLLNLGAHLGFPGTYMSDGHVASSWDVVYFTLLTFSSGGYGDVLPASALGKALSASISVAGLIYATILFGALFQRLRGD